MVIISIEGPVGAGKTTLIENIEKRLNNFKSVGEDIFSYTHFQSKDGFDYNPLLEMYSKPKENTVAAQIHLMDSCVRNQKEKMPMLKAAELDLSFHVVTDRCFFSCPVFIYLAFENGYISAFTRDFLLNLHEQMVHQNKVQHPDLKIYLNPPVDDCVRDIKRRQRTGEEIIDAEHLTRLSNLLLAEQAQDSNSTILSVSAQDSPDDVFNKFVSILRELNLHFSFKSAENQLTASQ